MLFLHFALLFLEMFRLLFGSEFNLDSNLIVSLVRRDGLGLSPLGVSEATICPPSWLTLRHARGVRNAMNT